MIALAVILSVTAHVGARKVPLVDKMTVSTKKGWNEENDLYRVKSNTFMLASAKGLSAGFTPNQRLSVATPTYLL